MYCNCSNPIPDGMAGQENCLNCNTPIGSSVSSEYTTRYDNGSGYMESFEVSSSLEVAVAQSDQVIRLGVATEVDVVDESGNVVWSGTV